MKHALAARLPDQLASRLERAILAGEHRPGERLPVREVPVQGGDADPGFLRDLAQRHAARLAEQPPRCVENSADARTGVRAQELPGVP